MSIERDQLLLTPIKDINLIGDEAIQGLIEELIELRGGRFAHNHQGLLLHFLQSFFAPDDGGKFIPIKSDDVIIQTWLSVKVSATKSDTIRKLHRELTAGIMDTAEDPYVYVSLSKGMKPRCLLKKKVKTKKVRR